MIFLGNNSTKSFVLFVLVLVIGGGIFLKWFKINSIEQSEVKTEFSWESVGNKFSQAWENIVAEIDLNKFESKQTWEEFQRQNQEDKFIQEVKIYLENYSTSTHSTSTDETQDEEGEEDDIDNR